MEQIKFQVVEKFILTSKTCDESKLIAGLKGDKMKAAVIPIREALVKGDKETADDLKKALPALLISGLFEGGRTADKLASYSRIICLDLDKVDESKVNTVKEKACDCEYTFIAFVSPSGRGVKIFVKVSTGPNYHKDAYRQVVKFYSDLLGAKFDEKTDDVSRLTFMSYDPDPYHYPDSKVFQVTTPIVTVPETPSLAMPISDSTEQFKTLYDSAYHYAEKKEKNEEGNRNNFLFLLSSNCNRYGIPKDVFLKQIDWCDLPCSEVKATVDSAYRRVECFGTWQSKKDDRRNVEIKQIEKPQYAELVRNTPIISSDTKRRLPAFLAELIKGYTDDRQSDMALTSLLSILSGMMNNTKGVYNNTLFSPELYSIITAPSGSGKSVTGSIQRLFMPLHSQLLKGGEYPTGLFVPDNTTTSALIKHMADNGGRGVLFSTDMGFLTHALKRDTAGLQAILRTAQSSENFGSGRSVKRSAISVRSPKLAACLSATPPEFKYLFTLTEDGLISRFIHYCFVPDRRWQDIKSISIAEYNHRQQQASEQILTLYNYTERNSFEFKLTEEQLLALNETLTEQMELAKSNDNWTAISPIIKRVGQTAFKLSMIIATVRAWESKIQGGILTISADDFNIVMQLMHVYFQHASSIVNYVIDDAAQVMDVQLNNFYSKLPNGQFKRKEAIEVAKQYGINVSERTVDNWLKRLVDLGVLTSGYNSYSKVKEDDIEPLQQAA